MSTDLWASAADTATGGGGFSLGTLALYIGGAVLLAFFSSIGLLARMRDRRLEERKEQGPTARRPTPSAGVDIPGNQGGPAAPTPHTTPTKRPA